MNEMKVVDFEIMNFLTTGIERIMRSSTNKEAERVCYIYRCHAREKFGGCVSDRRLEKILTLLTMTCSIMRTTFKENGNEVYL